MIQTSSLTKNIFFWPVVSCPWPVNINYPELGSPSCNRHKRNAKTYAFPDSVIGNYEEWQFLSCFSLTYKGPIDKRHCYTSPACLLTFACDMALSALSVHRELGSLSGPPQKFTRYEEPESLLSQSILNRGFTPIARSYSKYGYHGLSKIFYRVHLSTLVNLCNVLT